MLEALKEAIERLNRHAEVMNTPADPSGLTPYQVIGRLAALYGRGVEASNLGLAGLESWTADLFRGRCLDVEELQAYLESLGPPGDHPWRGVRRVEPILHAELRELAAGLGEAITSLDTIAGAATELGRDLGLPAQPDVPPAGTCRNSPSSRSAWSTPRRWTAPGSRTAPGPSGRPRSIGSWRRGRDLAEAGFLERYRGLERLRGLPRAGRPAGRPPVPGRRAG